MQELTTNEPVDVVVSSQNYVICIYHCSDISHHKHPFRIVYKLMGGAYSIKGAAIYGRYLVIGKV